MDEIAALRRELVRALHRQFRGPVYPEDAEARVAELWPLVEAAFGLVRTQVIAEALDAVSVYRDEVLGKLDTSQPTQRALHALANEWLTGARSAVFGLAQENKTP